ncbi:MAG: hypothetical protein ACSW8C_01365 [bacterium]
MRSLKNIRIIAVLFCNVAFSDITCIYNDTGKDLQIKEIKTGSWRFEHFILEEDLCRFDKVLKDSSDFEVNIPPQSGFLIKYRYGYKKGSRKASILLTSLDKKILFDIDPTSDEEGTSYQESYKIIQQSRMNQDTKMDPEEQKWWFSCDKMIIISNKK